MNPLLATLGGVLAGLALLLTSLLGQTVNPTTPETVFGGVTVGNEYRATSTAASATYGAWTTGRLVKTGTGSLGTIIITGANTGVINVYDATTTSVLKRATSKATSTILVASFPASTAAGNYVFDVEIKDGLYIDLVSGLMPTTTITYR